MIEQNPDRDCRIFALVHDSIIAEVRDEDIEWYKHQLAYCVQADRGVSIPGCPVGIDIDVAEDYSLGKYEKYFADAA